MAGNWFVVTEGNSRSASACVTFQFGELGSALIAIGQMRMVFENSFITFFLIRFCLLNILRQEATVGVFIGEVVLRQGVGR
ncbi:hypothetical protein BK660_04040 [Pseudomonas brassicacearum]|uniref:Uncharacterized protein n=1 Tax=Pseudomonas brassicacearum TaxID=930166 RepID=A0A423IHD6_9PSED|nr:hypothetical protein BK660_04040 [Pseudomonas brassicacearum]